MLRKTLMGVAALLVSLVTMTLVVLLGTITHADAVSYSHWIDATRVTDPLPGQLYAVSRDGEIEEQICRLERDDFDISSDALPGRVFVNRLGEAVPVALWVAQSSLQAERPIEHDLDIGYRLEWRSLERDFAPLSALTVGLRRILQERDMAAIEQHASAAKLAEMKRLEGCADAILQTFRHGLDVCQLTEVIKESKDRVLAVRFGTQCLALDPDGGPRPLPDLAATSFWTSVKLHLGLVNQILVSPLVADSTPG